MRGGELRGRSEDGAPPPFKLPSDIHDERGPHRCIRCRIDDLEWPEGISLDRQLLQPGQKAAFVTERCGMVVVRVAPVPIGKNHRMRPQLAYLFLQRQLA